MAHLAARALSPAEQDHAGDLSVDHPAFVESYRAAYAIKTRDGDGRATTLCPEPGGTHLAEVEGGSMVDASIPARLALFCSPTTSG